MKRSTYRLHRGFTLIEVLITLAILVLLASIAFPIYQSYVLRANRSAAQAQMMDMASREQQYFMANRSYADANTLGMSLPSQVTSKYSYDIQVQSDPVPKFTLTFTPRNGQESDGTLTLTSEGVKSPANKW